MNDSTTSPLTIVRPAKRSLTEAPKAINGAFRRGEEAIIEAGLILIESLGQIEYGEKTQWIKDNIEVSVASAYRAIKAARTFLTVRKVGDVLESLSEPIEIPEDGEPKHVTETPDTTSVAGSAHHTPPPATPSEPILCHQCKRNVRITGNPDAANPRCPECRELRRESAPPKPPTGGTTPPHDSHGRPIRAPKPPPPPREVLMDKVGHIIPDRCRDAWADPTLLNLIAEIEAAQAMITAAPWVRKAADLCTHYPFLLITKFDEHAFEIEHRFELVRVLLASSVPYSVCPTCNATADHLPGTCCADCRGSGLVPEHRYLELTNGRPV